MELVGVVSRLFRYGVKSMLGEELSRAHIVWNGVREDRGWVVVREDGVVVTAKMPEGRLLLQCQVEVIAPRGYPKVTLPDGKTYGVGTAKLEAALSELLGKRVHLKDVRRDGGQDLPTNYVPKFSLRPGVGVDSSPLHMISTHALGTLEMKAPQSLFVVERFRPNIMVMPTREGQFPEDDWVGHVLKVGSAELYVRKQTDRCPLTTRQQPGLPRDPWILETIKREHDNNLGIYATVVTPGVIRRGDEISIA